MESDLVVKYAKGCVFGAWCGDALGTFLENRLVTPEGVEAALEMNGGGAFNVGPGQFTDDSELSLCVLRSLAENPGVLNLDAIGRYYGLWIDSPPFDLGWTTNNALENAIGKTNPAKFCIEAAKEKNLESMSNGCMMRQTPLAVWCRNLQPDDVTRATMAEVSITHSNPTAQNACVVYNQLIWHLLNHPGDSTGAIHHATSFADETVGEWLREEPTNPSSNIGFVRHGLTWAVKCLTAQTPFYHAMKDILTAGGDTDTNAAIVGGVMGAFWGTDHITPQWIHKVSTYAPEMGGPSRPDWLHARSNLNYLDEIICQAPTQLTIWLHN